VDWHHCVNPLGNQLGNLNAVLSGTARSYHVPEFEGTLSIKTIVTGSAVWRAGGRRFVLEKDSWLVLNDRQHYMMDIQSKKPTTAKVHSAD
jgi:uncharacterized alpha-E superfamily protein